MSKDSENGKVEETKIIERDGSIRFYRDDCLHRDGDSPAIIFPNDTKYFYKNGKKHRDGDKPAVIFPDGTKYFYKNGELHRDGDKPAVVFPNGTKYFYKNGKKHRDGDKPALIFPNGTKYWYKNNVFIKEEKPSEKEKTYTGTTMSSNWSSNWCNLTSIDKGDYSYTISSNSSNCDNLKVINPNGEFILEKDTSLEKMKLKIGDKLTEIEVSKEDRIKILNATVESQRERIKNLKHNLQELSDVNDKLNKKIEEDFDKYTKLWKKKNNQKGSKSIWDKLLYNPIALLIFIIVCGLGLGLSIVKIVGLGLHVG